MLVQHKGFRGLCRDNPYTDNETRNLEHTMKNLSKRPDAATHDLNIVLVRHYGGSKIKMPSKNSLPSVQMQLPTT